MYSRVIDEQVVTFEASGGLLNAGLVMLDRVTKSYWSIMTEESIWGQFKGQRLQPLQGARKMKFGEWRALHPNTRVLSNNGVQHAPRNPYDHYFTSTEGFRGLRATDRRLKDKALLYGLHVGDAPWIVGHRDFDGGGVADVGGRQLFLYRLSTDSPFQGTAAFWVAPGDVVEQLGPGWILRRGESAFAFDATTRSFPDALALESATGFDTYWYIWSLTNPQTQIAGAGS